MPGKKKPPKRALHHAKMSVSGVVFKSFELLPRACSRGTSGSRIKARFLSRDLFCDFRTGLRRTPANRPFQRPRSQVRGASRGRVFIDPSLAAAPGIAESTVGPPASRPVFPRMQKEGLVFRRPPFRGPLFQGLLGPAGVRGAGGIVSVQVGPSVISLCGAVTVVAASCTGSAIALTIASAVVAVVDPLVNAVTLARVNGVTCQCNGQSSGHSIGCCRVMLTQWSLD